MKKIGKKLLVIIVCVLIFASGVVYGSNVTFEEFLSNKYEEARAANDIYAMMYAAAAEDLYLEYNGEETQNTELLKQLKSYSLFQSEIVQGVLDIFESIIAN